MTDLIGKTLGKYKILEEIGRGGMATVYKAVDITTRQTVALKVLPPYFQHDPALLRRFQREAEAATRLRHPHIVYAAEFDGNMEIYVMNADGSGVTRLTNHPAWDGEPSWSPR